MRLLRNVVARFTASLDESSNYGIFLTTSYAETLVNMARGSMGVDHV